MDSNQILNVSGGGEMMNTNSYSASPLGASNNEETKSSDVGWALDPTDIPSDHYVRHYRQVNSPTWDGGPYIFEGKHEDFCFVCGSSMELFECQTCDTSYHASCMTPSLDPSEVPDFWFCPHCIDNQLHIPQPPPTTYFTPPPPLSPSTSPSIASRTRNSSSAHAAPPHRRVYENTSRQSSRDIPMLDKPSSISPKPQASPEKAAPPPPTPSNTASRPDIPARSASKPGPKGNTGRPRRSYSPPRKKSKYSAFSSEVDKALVVIHKELEAAAQIGKSEAGLRDRIQMLEQELRLKDGQITLTSRELELAKKNSGDSSSLKAENDQLKAEISRLNQSLERKDSELRDWRTRLKSMIGE